MIWPSLVACLRGKLLLPGLVVLALLGAIIILVWASSGVMLALGLLGVGLLCAVAVCRDVIRHSRLERAHKTAMAEMEREKNAMQAIFLGTAASTAAEVFRLIAMSAASALEADGVVIAEIKEPGPGHADTLAVWLDGEYRDNFRYHLDFVPDGVAFEHEYVCVNEAVHIKYPQCPIFTRMGAEAYVGMPFFNAQREAIGHMAVIYRRPLVDESRSVAIMKIFATRVGAELERAVAERALREARDRAQHYLDIASVMLMSLDDEGRVTMINRKGCEVTGYAEEELLHRNWFALCTPMEGREELAAHFRDIAQGCDIPLEYMESKLLTKDGAVRTIAWHCSPLRGVDSAGGGVLLSGDDITEQQRAEVERRVMYRQLVQGQKMEAIGQLTGGIAHDFNNMLASILGFTELALESAKQRADETQTEYLGEVMQAGDRARNLVAKMLAFSRGRDLNAPQPIHLPSTLSSILKLLRPLLPSTVKVRMELDSAVGSVLVDTVELQQLLMNLCTNARDAMEGTGQLTVAVQRATLRDAVCSSCQARFSGNYVDLSVHDTGPGIPDGALPRLFEPFFTTKEAGKGAGMGLSVVHGIMHDRMGHVVAETTPGEGSRIRLLFVPHYDVAGGTW